MLVAASEVVHSFTSDQPRLRVAGRLSKTYLKAGENVDGLALSILLNVSGDTLMVVHRNEFQSQQPQPARNRRPPLRRASWQHHDGGDSIRPMSAAHTDPSFGNVVAAFSL